MNKELLASLGLNSSETAVYEAVLKAGSIDPAALAKASGIKRTTAYSVARGLVEKRLLIEDATKRPRAFTPAGPKEVLALVEADKKRAAERETKLTRLASELSKLSSTATYPVPTVRFIEEGRVRDFLKQQSPVWDKNMLEIGEPTWWGSQDHTLVEHYGDWITWYWNRAPKEIDLKLLSNRADAEVEFGATADPRRGIKFWGEAANFLSTTWAIGDYLVMINTRTKPFYLVEIHDKLMAHDQREVFKNLWPLV